MTAATHPPWRAAKSERISHSFHHLDGLGQLGTGQQELDVRYSERTGSDRPVLVPGSIVSVRRGFFQVDLLMEYSRHGCSSRRGVGKNARHVRWSCYERNTLPGIILLGKPLSVVLLTLDQL